MAQLPDNIVSIMMVDNAGAVVSVPVGDLFASPKSTNKTSVQKNVASVKVAPSNQIVSNNISSEALSSISILATEGYITAVGKDINTLVNSPLYISGSNVNMSEGDFNVTSKNGINGYKINGHNLAFAYGNIIYIGDDNNPSIAAQQIYLTALIEDPAIAYSKILQVEPDGKVVAYDAPAINSVIFSDGDKLVGDVTKLSWNAATSVFTVVGSAKASAGILTSSIGEYTTSGGVNANNSWTFSSNVTVPAIPTNPTHAASKDYVDNTALTGLKLGASVKTVSLTDITLTGLSDVNGYTPTTGDRILVIGQTVASTNGVYVANAATWTRDTDSDSDAELRGYQYLITAGTNANFRYGNTNQSTITVGVTSITYQTISAGETDPIFIASPSFGITGTNITNWNTSYNRSPVSLAFSGTSTKTITLTKQDGSTLSDSFTFPVTSVFGRTGAVVLTSGDVSTALGYTAYNGSTNPNGYITGITSGNVTTALGFTPYNATNPNGYISGITSGQVTTALGYTPLASYTETDTLASVTGRGASTSTDITSTSTISAVGGFFEPSDIRFKNVLGTNPDIDVSKIDTIKYMRTVYDKDKIRYGYSAQDVYDIIPDCVNDDGTSLSINYTDIHTLKILQLERRIAELEAKLDI